MDKNCDVFESLNEMENVCKKLQQEKEKFNEIAESLTNAIAFDVIDWATTKRMAWVYGIILGWDDESYEELQFQYKWSDETVCRNKRLHKNFNEMLQE